MIDQRELFDPAVKASGTQIPLRDMNQLPVTPYPGGVPHVAGSDTSIAAAESMKNRTGPMQAEILRLLQGSSRGLTCDAVERITGWAHQSASARLRELVLAELVVDSGERRKGRSGRSGRVYRLA